MDLEQECETEHFPSQQGLVIYFSEDLGTLHLWLILGEQQDSRILARIYSHCNNVCQQFSDSYTSSPSYSRE
jgi:hypothetical protein